MDDFVIKALLDSDCLRKLVESEKKVSIPSKRDPWATALKLADAARADDFELTSSKRVLHLFQALIGFGANSATLAERVIEHAVGTPSDRVFELPEHFLLP